MIFRLDIAKILRSSTSTTGLGLDSVSIDFLPALYATRRRIPAAHYVTSATAPAINALLRLDRINAACHVLLVGSNKGPIRTLERFVHHALSTNRSKSAVASASSSGGMRMRLEDVSLNSTIQTSPKYPWNAHSRHHRQLAPLRAPTFVVTRVPRDGPFGREVLHSGNIPVA